METTTMERRLAVRPPCARALPNLYLTYSSAPNVCGVHNLAVLCVFYPTGLGRFVELFPAIMFAGYSIGRGHRGVFDSTIY